MTLAQMPNATASWKLAVPTSLPVGDLDSSITDIFQKAIDATEKSAVNTPVVRDLELRRSIVRIESRFENKKTGYSIWKTGNGWMIRPDMVITTGDIVCDTEYQLGVATEVKCYVGARGLAPLSGSQTELVYGQRIITSNEWSDGADGTDGRSRDIALIQMAKPLAIDVCTYGPFEDVKVPEPVTSVVPVTPLVSELEKPVCCAGCGGACGNSKSVPTEPSIEEDVEEPVAPIATDANEEVVEDPFYVTLATVSKIDTESLNIESPLIADVGQFVSIVGGTLLRYIVGAETIASGKSTKVAGAAERALLAEACLEAVLAIEESPELDQIVEKMKQNWDAKAPTIDEAAMLLSPYIAEPASDILVFHEEDVAEQVDVPKKHKRRALGIRHFTGPSVSAGSNDFVQGLFGPTFPLSGRESVFSSLGPVLRGGIRGVEQIVSERGQGDINQRVPKLLQKVVASSGSPSSTTEQDIDATRVLLQRAVMADTALQALSDLPRAMLASLRLIPLTTTSLQIENIFDFIKAAVQRMGPTALLPAQHAAKKFSVILLDAPSKPQVVRKPIETVKARPRSGKLALRDRLKSTKSVV